jgi:hypothetical protein
MIWLVSNALQVFKKKVGPKWPSFISSDGLMVPFCRFTFLYLIHTSNAHLQICMPMAIVFMN